MAKKSWFKNIKNNLKKDFIVLYNRDIFLAIMIFLPILVTAIFLGYDNNQIIPVTKDIGNLYLGEPNNYLKFLSNWDGVIYLKIASSGYAKFNLINFFPFYPLIVSLVHKIIPSLLESGLLISWISYVGALYFYIKIVRYYFLQLTKREIVQATLLFAVFPSAIFMLGTFTEGLFAFLALASFYYSLKNQWIKASLLIALATATRINGIFLVALMVLILWKNKLPKLKIILSAEIGVIGLLSYMIYLKYKFHKILGFVQTQYGHGWLQASFWSAISHTSIFNLLFLILVILSILYWYHKDKILAFYSFLFFLIPVVGGKFGGFPRYSLMDFTIPLMIFAISRKKPLVYNIAILLFGILWTYLLIQYVGGYIGG